MNGGPMNLMANGFVRLKGRELLDKYGTSMYRLAKDGDVSYPTIHKYITDPESVQMISSEVLFGILINGLGLTVDEVKQLKLGEVFDFVPKESEPAQ
jgi:hypothetical protein